MSEGLPRGHVIEIWEEGASSGPGAGDTIFAPDMASIDGHRLLMPLGGIRVHEMKLGNPDDPVLVTLTLYARRVTIGAELDGPDGEPAAAAGVRQEELVVVIPFPSEGAPPMHTSAGVRERLGEAAEQMLATRGLVAAGEPVWRPRLLGREDLQKNLESSGVSPEDAELSAQQSGGAWKFTGHLPVREGQIG